MKYVFPLLFLLCLLAVGCASESPLAHGPWDGRPRVDVIAENHTAGDALAERMDSYGNQHLPILVASFVNLDQLDETSTLGRLIAQQVGSRISGHGYPVVDARIRSDALLVRDGSSSSGGPAGEFSLSRRIGEINAGYGAHAVLAGTYTVAYNAVFVSARVLRCSDGVILAAHDYRLPYNPQTLSPQGFSAARAGSADIVPSVRTTF